MSNTKKVLIAIGAVILIGVLCFCSLVTILFIFGGEPASTTNPQTDQQVNPTPHVSPATQPPEIPSASLIPAGSEFVLDGVTVNVYSVIYTTINGGEDSASYLVNSDQVYLLVSLYSNEKDLSFVYDKYIDSIALIEPDIDRITYFDHMNWSDNESPVNSGYMKISFPISTPALKAVLHITDGVDIDISPMIPTDLSYEDPWLEARSPFVLDGVELQIQSIDLYDNYLSPADGSEIVKGNSTDKIMVVSFSSPQNDLSQFEFSLPFILIDQTNANNQYVADYYYWTYGESQEPGDLQYVFVIPEYTGKYTLYIPYDTLIDLTPALGN